MHANDNADKIKCTISGRDVEIYPISTGWTWRSGHYEEGRMAWWGWDFIGAGRDFPTALDAQQDAVNRLGSKPGTQITGNLIAEAL